MADEDEIRSQFRTMQGDEGLKPYPFSFEEVVARQMYNRLLRGDNPYFPEPGAIERLPEYSARIQDRRRPVPLGSTREALATMLSAPIQAGAGFASLLGLERGGDAGVLANQLGLGDIPNAGLLAQLWGMARQLRESDPYDVPDPDEQPP